MLNQEQQALHDKIVEHVLEQMLIHPDQSDIQQFIDCPVPQLIGYHHTLGRDIRNTFGLHGHPALGDDTWMLIHPDTFSMMCIKEIHSRAVARFRKQLVSLK